MFLLLFLFFILGTSEKARADHNADVAAVDVALFFCEFGDIEGDGDGSHIFDGVDVAVLTYQDLGSKVASREDRSAILICLELTHDIKISVGNSARRGDCALVIV